MIEGWQGVAFNADPHSKNEIHGDDLAQQFGFEGGLVPGVTISAYLTHPAVVAWGMDFLNRGYAHVQVLSPLYDDETFTVEITQRSDAAYSAQLLRPDGTISAIAEVALTAEDVVPPARRGDPLADNNHVAMPPTPETFAYLQRNGCKVFQFPWHKSHIMRSYLRDDRGMPALLKGEQAYANMSYILGVSNWTADSHVAMNPWVHLETRSQNFFAIADDTPVISEMRIQTIFEKKGHRFFDAQVTLFDERSDQCLSDIALRAIYQLRPSTH